MAGFRLKAVSNMPGIITYQLSSIITHPKAHSEESCQNELLYICKSLSSKQSHYDARTHLPDILYSLTSTGTGVAGFIDVFFWQQSSEFQANRMRIMYLASLLNQDIAYFDTVEPVGGLLQVGSLLNLV